MIEGHGDDRYRYGEIRADFSSNVPAGADLSGLRDYLFSHFDRVMHYPEPEPRSLERALARRLEVDDRCIMVTAGATEAIYLVARIFAGERVAIAEPTFAEYGDACRMFGCDIAETDDPFCPPADAAAQWFCNPNNPTGRVWDADKVRAAAENYRDKIFVADHSYGYFTHMPLLSPAETVALGNMIQIGSMTKRYAIPGLRLGYLVAPSEICDRLRRLRAPWSVNAMAIDAGHYLLDHEIGTLSADDLIAECRRIAEVLNCSGRFVAEPTDTHFMLVHSLCGTAAELKEYLVRSHGILIRDASNFRGLDAGCFRIAARTPEDNDLLINALKQWK